ncbi:hypothetical protein ACXR6G_14825 [Ancylomarina sp. YFZ004]
MKANLLDEIIRKHLKGQTNTPDNIIFRKDRIYQSLETKIAERSNRKWHLAVAILILVISSSGYWNYEQQRTIRYQSNELNRQQNMIVSITNESEQQIASKNILTDSLKDMRKQINNEPKIVRLVAMPTIIINQPIVFKNKIETEHITIRYITINTKPELQERKLPELDLPVVYESETLANNNISEKNSAALSKKIRKLLNN